MEIFDIVQHKGGTIGRVRAIYSLPSRKRIRKTTSMAVNDELVLDVEIGDGWKNMMYATPAKNWRVVAKEEETNGSVL